jgi:hypothetical protein
MTPEQVKVGARRIDLFFNKERKGVVIHYPPDVSEESVKTALDKFVANEEVRRALLALSEGKSSRILTDKGSIIGIQIPEDLPKAV